MIWRVSETTDLAAALLAAEPAERERLLRETAPSDLAPALTQLGHTRQPAAADVLALIDLVVEDRAVRKAARRELHRLRSMGVEPSSPVQVTSEPAPSRQPTTLAISEAWATDIDSTGARAVWLLADKPLGGVWFAPMLLNDQRGLVEMNLVDTTRKRFLRDMQESRKTAGTWVRLPGEYALALVREAVDLTREVGGGLPTRYHAFRDVFGEAPAPPERALVYATISPVEVNFHPEWLDESGRLTAEPEVAGWYVPLPAELRARALEVARAPTAGLLVPGHTPEQQALQLLADAAHQALTPLMQRALRRRLEETAYVFLATDRLSAARLAVAAARGVGDSHLLAAERHPLLRMLLEAGLVHLTGSEMVGSRRAWQVLLDLIESTMQREGQPGAVETRPSGLILPR
jgi:hypothetical protein